MRLFHALATVFATILLAVAALTAQQKNPLTNADVIKMVKAGMAENTIAAAIAGSDTQFDLSSTGLQTLSQAGVSSKVIRAMLAAESKKKDAAAAAENSTPAQDSSTAQGSAPDASSGLGPEGMSSQGMPLGMSSDQMQQMMNNMPPEMRERMQASMAQRNARRSGRGGGSAGSANSIPPHGGVPVPLDSALYTSFTRLKTQPGYHMVMTMQTSDPKMAAMAQSIFSPQEMLVVGNTRQYTMHYKMPATDVPGTVDDWEIRAVVQNGRAARLITSAAVPRLLKESEEKAAHDLTQLDRMAATTTARAAAEGPMGAIGAGMTAAGVALAHVEAPKMKKERDMFSWQRRDVPQGEPGAQSTTQLTDFHPIGNQDVNGVMADGYEFYSYDTQKTQGTVHLLVAKDTGLPLRIEMVDPNGAGGIQMNYGPLTGPANIEIPACMNGK
jgi:hypothetical protein